MTITQLKYALSIAEHKNFTKAAEKCFVTQPTLSTQIQKLEDELDVIIFDRGKKPIELTEVGRKIVFQARNIVNEAERIQDIVDQQKGFIGGEFRLGIIPTVMPTLLPMFLQNFIKKYPKVKLKIEELTTEEIRQIPDLCAASRRRGTNPLAAQRAGWQGMAPSSQDQITAETDPTP